MSNSDKVYSVWCEYDIGQEGIFFTSEQSAWAWVDENLVLGEDSTVQEWIRDGMVSVESGIMHS